jgi:hypothetical protein
MVQVLTFVYLCIAGFVAAGVLASLHQLVTARPPQFVMPAESFAAGLGAAVVCVFGGPFIVMRNAIRGRRIEHRPLGWLAASFAIASLWSLCSGIVIVDFARRVIGAMT